MGTLGDGLRPIIQQLEQKHGPMQSWPRTGSSPAGTSSAPRCPTCQDQGWVNRREPNPNASVPLFRAVACPGCPGSSDPNEEQVLLWQLSGIADTERQRCRIETWDRQTNAATMRAAFSAAADWGQGKGPPFLLLLGADRGIGKTHLAIAAANECIQRGVAVRYLIVPGFLDALRATQRPGAERALADVRRPAETYPALILDDLGAGKDTDWADEQLFTIVNERWRRELRTLVTSNVAAGRIEARTRSRLCDARLSRVVPCEGRDYRQRK